MPSTTINKIKKNLVMCLTAGVVTTITEHATSVLLLNHNAIP